ncbi:MAG TPA: hypothetical protein VFY35_17385 [Burkholderiaceae bacterium]|nr:hypothetical protein [Burkholderiaceae bacterium]
MLRRLVLVLLLANLAYAAWSQAWWTLPPGWLPDPTPTREPERLAQQIAPERVQVLHTASAEPPKDTPATATTTDTSPTPDVGTAPDATPSASPLAPTEEPPPTAKAEAAPKTESTQCLQISGMNDKQYGVLQTALASALPNSGWVLKHSTQAARWLVYSGKLSSPDIMATKKAELRELKVEFREVTTPALQPGLAMGTYSSEERAQHALKDVTRAGVKGARVVQERPETLLTTVQWPKANEGLKEQVQALVKRLGDEGLEGKPLQPCP